jgi:hypothetical protein
MNSGEFCSRWLNKVENGLEILFEVFSGLVRLSMAWKGLAKLIQIELS